MLVSWAVPKGRRESEGQAHGAPHRGSPDGVRGSFEGVIPEGEYGAGRVIVWDQRHLHSDRDMSEGLERGHLSFRLDGEKLHGGFALTRLREGKDEAWLLVKKSDEDADGRRKPVRSQPESVLSGRTARRVVVKVPAWQSPTLATLTDKRFSDRHWIFERKLDGVRGLAFRDGDDIRLMSRNRLSLNNTYPEIVEALAEQDTRGS